MITPTAAAGTGFDQTRVGGAINLGAESVLVVVNDPPAGAARGAAPPQARGAVYTILADANGNPRAVNGSFLRVLFDGDGLDENGGERVAVENAAVLFDRSTGQLIFTGLNDDSSVFSQLGSENGGAAFAALVSASEMDNGDNQISSGSDLGALIRNAVISGNITQTMESFTPQFTGSVADFSQQANISGLGVFRTRVANPQVTNPQVGRFSAVPREPGEFSAIFSTSVSDFNGSDPGVEGTFVSAMSGADYLAQNHLHLGGIVSRHFGEIKTPTGQVNIDNGYDVQAFANYPLMRNLSLFSSAIYARQYYDLSRATQQGTVTGDTNGKSLGLNLGLNSEFRLENGLTISPFVTFSQNYYYSGSFAETGAVDALSYGAYRARSLRGSVGLDVEGLLPLTSKEAYWRVSFGVDQRLSENRSNRALSLLSDPRVSYSIRFKDSTPTQYKAGLGVDYKIHSNHWLSADYTGSFGGGTGHNGLKLTYRLGF